MRIALSDGITPSRLPTLLALCRQEEPEVELRFFEVPLSQQIKGLHDDLYDVGFAQSDEVGDGIAVESVWSDPLMVAVPARHPLLKHKENGWQFQLFVRTDKKAPYRACGPFKVMGSHGEKPMNITLELLEGLPERLFEAFSVLRAA